MKSANALKSVVTLFLISFIFQTSFSQERVRGNMINSYSKMYTLAKSVVVENPVLKDGEYTYTYKEKQVSVEIKDGYYYEYHPEKEYIKAVIDWKSEYQYKLIIVDMEKRNVPLKVGSELTAEIVKIDGNKYFYTSRLNNKTGNGSFTKVK